MKVLITNAYLERYAGVEVVVRDLAIELERQGHQPMVYSPHPGTMANDIRAAGIKVVSDLGRLTEVPDVIHGQQFPELLEALLRFSSTPAVYVCHTATPTVDQPFYFPRIYRYVAVDQRCKKRLEEVPNIQEVQIIENAVDLHRFPKRSTLPEKPKQALVFSNYAERSTHLPHVRKACQQRGLKLDVVGLAAGTAVSDPGSVLPQYDIVFAKARCALEAMAAGCAVVLCDFAGAGPMVTAENFSALRPMNFGQGVLTQPLCAESLVAEIDRYDPYDAASVCELTRSQADLAVAAQHWLQIYVKAIRDFHSTPRDIPGEMLAIAKYLQVRSYETRVEWEKRQIGGLRRIPVVGDTVFRSVRNCLRRRNFN